MPSDSRPEYGEFVALQWTRTELCRLLRDYFRVTRSPADPPIRVGTSVPFYYDPADRLARVTPDLYVVEGLGYQEQLRWFRVWERGLGPRLVVHLVDTPVSPEDGLMMHFLRLGVEDVVLYDPLWYQQPQAMPTGRRLLWHYRRRDEALKLVPQEHPARVHLERYRLWLAHRGGADLRIYLDRREDAGAPAAFPPESACWPTLEEQVTKGVVPPVRPR